jgi:uncharacterized repeat protein (TIGR03803 family)
MWFCAYGMLEHRKVLVKEDLMSMSKSQAKLALRTVLRVLLFVLSVAAIPSMRAQTLTVLYSFSGGADGSQPLASLVRDAAGNLYGTTQIGGTSGNGVVFKVDPSGAETVLHSFAGKPDGSEPAAGLLRDGAGNLYGTTEFGGVSGVGMIFKLSSAGKVTVIHNFRTADDGENPVAGLVSDMAGDLYGTTCCGGNSLDGIVFKVNSARDWTVLHNFAGSDGRYPFGGLIRDSAGNLYGTTSTGGASGFGTVFKLDAGGAETLLYSFTGGLDGANPQAGVIRDGAGNLYGTAVGGGTSGNGVVFKVTPAGKERVLFNFTGGEDGGSPYAGLVGDSAGNLYGTTSAGGAFAWGTIFELDKAGTETVLYSFTGGADGSCPMAALIQDSVGNLYGTTEFGGVSGFGVVFELTP